MAVQYTATLIIQAVDQEEVFNMFSELVDVCIDISNSSPGVIDVEELDPKKLVYVEVKGE